MATFKDRNNRDWIIEWDGPILETIEQETGFDISPEDGSGLIEACVKGVTVVRICWFFCQKQAEAANVTDEAFGHAMASGEVIEGAEKALKQALTDFTRPSRRGVLTANLTTQERVTEETLAAYVAKVSDPETRKQIVDAAKAGMTDTLAEIKTRMKASRSSANATPATSESVPTG